LLRKVAGRHRLLSSRRAKHDVAEGVQGRLDAYPKAERRGGCKPRKNVPSGVGGEADEGRRLVH